MEREIKKILSWIGENPEREGLRGTPDRVVRMWKELYRGYDMAQKPKITVFPNGSDGIAYDQMIIDSGNFYSTCEHHMMPFFGKYYFAYIPSEKGLILGLSKVARVVDYFSARLQIQERLGSDIVEYLWSSLDNDLPPLGMAIVLQGEHLCKSMRGVRKKGLMTTAYLKGVFKQSNVKEELNQYINRMS